jgi:hypothetical protein
MATGDDYDDSDGAATATATTTATARRAMGYNEDGGGRR